MYLKNMFTLGDHYMTVSRGSIPTPYPLPSWDETPVTQQMLDFQKSPSSDFIWRGTKDFSYLIGANFTDPKTGRCAWTNQNSSQGPLGIKLSLTCTKRTET